MTSGSTGLFSRMRRGAGAQGFSQAVQIFVRLAEVPLLLGFWGVQLYGEWLMVAAIPVYLAIADGGFAGAAGREMTMRTGRGDRSGALSVFHSTWVLLLLVSVGLGFLAAVVVHVTPLAEWLHFEAMDSATLKVVILILTAHILVGFQTGLLYGGYQCEGRYGLGMFLTASMLVLEFGGLAAAVVLGGGPVEAAAGYLAGRVSGFILLRLGLYRVAPWLRYGWREASRREVTRLTSPAFASLAFPLGNALNIQGMRLVVGVVLGPAAVAMFSPIRTLSRLAMQPRGIVNRLIQPEMALAFGGDNYELFRMLFRHSCQVALWGGVVACLLLGVAGETVLEVWTQGKVPMDWALYVLLLLTAATNALWYTALMVAYATNRHQRIAVVYSLVYGGAAFAVAYAGAKMAGVAGVGGALLVAEIAMAAYVIPAARRLSGEGWATWLRTVVRPPWFLLQRIWPSGAVSRG